MNEKEVIIQNLTTHPGHDILDSTKIACFKRCPRLFFFQQVLGLKEERAQIDIDFGAAIHEALAYIYEMYKQGHRFTQDVVEEAKRIFATTFQHNDASLLDGSVKNTANAFDLIDCYVARWRAVDAQYEVINTEISGLVHISDTHAIYYRLDLITRDDNGLYRIMEHKTSGWSLVLWAASHRYSTQIGTYCQAARSLYDNKSAGVTLNGLFISKKGVDFHRVPFALGEKQLAMFRSKTLYWCDRIADEYAALHEDSIDAGVMHSFPQNDNGCIAFNRICPFHDICINTNPITDFDVVPQGFKRDYWDPRVQDENKEKQV